VVRKFQPRLHSRCSAGRCAAYCSFEFGRGGGHGVALLARRSFHLYRASATKLAALENLCEQTRLDHSSRTKNMELGASEAHTIDESGEQGALAVLETWGDLGYQQVAVPESRVPRADILIPSVTARVHVTVL
jgi:hypothetical protein